MARSALYVVALAAAAITLATTQGSFIYTEEDLASDDSMWALYERWTAHHEVVREHGEKVRRFPIFKNNARWILDKYGNKGKSAINIFGDMTHDEFITVASGLRESDQDVQCSGTLDPLAEGREHVLISELCKQSSVREAFESQP